MRMFYLTTLLVVFCQSLPGSFWLLGFLAEIGNKTNCRWTEINYTYRLELAPGVRRQGARTTRTPTESWDRRKYSNFH